MEDTFSTRPLRRQHCGQEQLRQVCGSGNIYLDHFQLAADVRLGKRAQESEACIVDKDIYVDSL